MRLISLRWIYHLQPLEGERLAIDKTLSHIAPHIRLGSMQDGFDNCTFTEAMHLGTKQHGTLDIDVASYRYVIVDDVNHSA